MTDNIEVLTHSSIRIRTDAGIVYIDPFGLRTADHDADFILVTHDHFDHFSPEDIEKAGNQDTVLIVPAQMEGKAKEVASIVGKLYTVTPGCRENIEGLELETVPAYNNLKPFHPKSAGWVGYIIVDAGKRIYIAGDTDQNKDNASVKCDVAMVPVGGTYTMDAKKAAEFVNALKPEVAIPTHYGSTVGKKEDAETFAKNVDSAIEVSIRMQY